MGITGRTCATVGRNLQFSLVGIYMPHSTNRDFVRRLLICSLSYWQKCFVIETKIYSNFKNINQCHRKFFQMANTTTIANSIVRMDAFRIWTSDDLILYLYTQQQSSMQNLNNLYFIYTANLVAIRYVRWKAWLTFILYSQFDSQCLHCSVSWTLAPVASEKQHEVFLTPYWKGKTK